MGGCVSQTPAEAAKPSAQDQRPAGPRGSGTAARPENPSATDERLSRRSSLHVMPTAPAPCSPPGVTPGPSLESTPVHGPRDGSSRDDRFESVLPTHRQENARPPHQGVEVCGTSANPTLVAEAEGARGPDEPDADAPGFCSFEPPASVDGDGKSTTRSLFSDKPQGGTAWQRKGLDAGRTQLVRPATVVTADLESVEEDLQIDVSQSNPQPYTNTQASIVHQWLTQLGSEMMNSAELVVLEQDLVSDGLESGNGSATALAFGSEAALSSASAGAAASPPSRPRGGSLLTAAQLAQLATDL